MNFLDKTYLTDQPQTIEDLKVTLNTDEQVENIAYLIEHSPQVPRLIHHLLQSDVLSELTETRLLTHLGLSFDHSAWPMKISLNTLIVLLKVLLKRKNPELIHSLWTRFLHRLSETSEDLTREHLQIFLLVFHQLSLTQRKSILLDLVQLLTTSERKENLYLLLLFDYFMFHFYEIPQELIEHLQQTIGKNDPTLVTPAPFSQILVKSPTPSQLDGFALKTLYHSVTYPSFYTALVEQLDFTRLLGRAADTVKVYYDLLWRILGYLPPSADYLARASTSTNGVDLLHSLRLEKKILVEKAIVEFLGKETTLSTAPRFAQLLTKKDQASLFDLIVYQILLQNLSPSKEEIPQLYRLFLDQFQASLKLDPYLQALASIPIAQPSAEATTTTNITLPTLPTEFEELLKFQLAAFFGESTVDLRSLCLRELLQMLVERHPELEEKSLFLEIQLNRHLHFLKDQVKFSTDSQADQMTEFIYRQIFRFLFDDQLPNSIITEQIYHDLLAYLEEHFSPSIFERCLPPHDLFDLLSLSAGERRRSVPIFARMLLLFNKIFASSHQFPPSFITSLNRLTELTEDELARWFSQLLLPDSTSTDEKITSLYTPEQCQQILATFTKYLIKKNDEGSTTLIDERVSRLLLTVLIRLADALFQPTKLAVGLPQIVELLVILAGHGSGQGHRQLFQAITRRQWLTSCANVLQAKDKDQPSLFYSNILQTSVDLLAYLNDLLVALKHLSSDPLESVDDEEDEDDDDEDDDHGQQSEGGSLPSSSSTTEYDPNKLCTYTTTKKEYANQHWYHCHSCKMIDRVGICQVCANVCHKDHEISYAKFGSFFCDCGAKEDGSCLALVKRTPTTSNNGASSVTRAEKTKMKKGAGKKRKLTHRQRRLVRQIGSEKEKEISQSLFNEMREISRETGRFFRSLQADLPTEYQEIFNGENRFDLIDQFLRGNEQLTIESDSSSFFTGVLHSQENTFEHLKLSLTNEHGQQIKQLLSTNSLRRQGLLVNLGEDQLIVSQEKGKQALISIFQFTSLLKQCQSTTLNTSNANDNPTKKKLTLSKLNSLNVPFTVLSMQVNQLNSNYLCLTGLKDCQVWNLDRHGRLKEPSTIIVQPNLDSTGNYIIRAQWLADRHQTQLALLTADFIKIFDLAVDPINPIFFFILPTGKVRDCTFYYTRTEGEQRASDACYIFIMASNGYIYYEQLSDSSSARNGSFYVTNTLEMKHESITETNNNGILLGGGVSVYFSCTLKLLFWSFVHGKNFYGIVDPTSIEKLLLIRSIDVKMTPTASSSSSSASATNNGNANTSKASTSTYHTLCAWAEIPQHPGLITTMTQMTNNPVILMISPTHLRVNEIKLPLKTTKIQDVLAVRTEQRSTLLLLLADDGSLKILTTEKEKCNYWLNQSYLKKKYFPLIIDELDLDESDPLDDPPTPLTSHRPRPVTQPIPSLADSTAATTSASVRFPVDFFESAQVLTEYEFGGRDLLDVYNVNQLKVRLSSPGMFVANVRTGGFTLEVFNKDLENMVVVGVRIHVGSNSMERSPQYFEFCGRTVQVNHQQGPRWYDLCLTREESIQVEKKLAIFVAPSLDTTNHVTVIDDVKVYGKTKGDFQWPDDLDLVSSSSAAPLVPSATGTHSAALLNGYLQSFRPSNAEKELATLSLSDQLLVYSLQVLRGTFTLQQEDPSKLVQEILPSISRMLELSLPGPLQRSSRQLLREFFTSDTEYHEHVDRLQLTLISRCFSSADFLSFFPQLEMFESLLLALLPISRSRPDHFLRYLSIPSSSSPLEFFLQCLMKIFLKFIDQRPVNRLRQALDHRLIEMKEIERVLSLLVQIFHHLALSDGSAISRPVIVDHYIRLLTHEDYRLNFLIKSALQRSLQPKSEPLTSKIQSEDDDGAPTTEKSFQPIPLSARVLTHEEEQQQLDWAAPADDTGILQYALALSLADNPPPPPPPPPPTTASSDASRAEATTTTTTVDDSETNSLDEEGEGEGEEGHVSSSSSTTNEVESASGESTKTTVVVARSTTTSSNDSNSTVQLSNEGNRAEERLMELKRSLLEEWIAGVKTNLLSNPKVNGLNAIASLQFFLSLTIEFASSKANEEWLDHLLQRLFNEMTFFTVEQSDDGSTANALVHRSPSNEIHLMFLRLFTILLSLIFKVRADEREQYLHLSFFTAEQLRQTNLLAYCLTALQQVYAYLQDDHPQSSSPLLKIGQSGDGDDDDGGGGGEASLPDLSPFFYKPQSRRDRHSPDSDLFESYPELLAEISTRLIYQLKKVFASRRSELPAERRFVLGPEWEKCLCEYYISPRTAFLKRQMRKFLMFICGSREKYRQLRDFHLLSTNLQEIKRLSSPSSSSAEVPSSSTEKKRTPAIPYLSLIRLFELFKSSEEISLQRSANWQHFCRKDSSILPFLFRFLLHVPHPSLVPSLLHLLINAISSPPPPSSSSSKALKSSQSVLPTASAREEREEDEQLPMLSSFLVVQLSKLLERDELEEFTRSYLLENIDPSIRWLTHSFLWHFYSNASRSTASDLFDLLLHLFVVDLQSSSSTRFSSLSIPRSSRFDHRQERRRSPSVEFRHSALLAVSLSRLVFCSSSIPTPRSTVR